MSYPTPDEFWNADGRGKLRMVAEALRSVPETHEWDFSDPGGRRGCGSVGCAAGLSEWLWGEPPQQMEMMDVLEEAAETIRPDGNRIFYSSLLYKKPSRHFVTPLMVADKIDELLRESAAPEHGETK